MLKKMRRRVIISALLVFYSVIAVIALLVNVANYYAVTDRADQTLSYIRGYEANAPEEIDGVTPPPGPFMALPDLEVNYMTRFFVVRFDEAGNHVSAYTDYIASVDEEEAVSYAKEVLKKGSEKGYYHDYRYLIETIGDNTVVIFLNVERDMQFVRSLRSLSIAVVGVSYILVFVLVVLFSGKAIKPIMNNIERQKQFITDASHELKTPLTSISTSVDVIELEHGEDEWTDNIRKQISRMTKLVSELVTLSRLDEETPLPAKESFSLSSAAWEIAEVYQPQARAMGKKFTEEIEENLTMVGAKNEIQSMLSVLLDNAIRYSDPEGEIRFTVKKKRNRIHIEVFNTCQLDEPPDVNRLFDRFYRPDSSRNSETGGNGIGLAIARAVAEAHGGTITASCPSGNTMTIHVTL